MHDLHGFEVFAVGERRAAGLRVAAQAHDRDGRVGPADALRADDAAAVLDLGDPADRLCGFVRAGNPLCRKVPRGF